MLLQQPPKVASLADLEFAAQAQVLLVELFYDLTCQDLPPDFEDNHQEFFGPQGIFLRFLDWNPPQIAGEACSPIYFNPFHELICVRLLV